MTNHAKYLISNVPETLIVFQEKVTKQIVSSQPA